MKKNKAQEIFEKYNPTKDVVRCPNGKAKMKKTLNDFAKAAVNLYGIIPLSEFVEIANHYNDDETNVDEVYRLLLPLILKNKDYGFYQDYLVHYVIIDDFTWVKYLLEHQADKPRYIPSKEEFLKYTSDFYEERIHWEKLQTYLLKFSGYQKFYEILNFIEGLKTKPDLTNLGTLLEKNNLTFENKEQLDMLLELIMEAINNTRSWENKGNRAIDLFSMLQQPDKIIPPSDKELELTEPCPCGSGKIYEKCCFLNEKYDQAHLSPKECDLFYLTWYKLLNFVNKSYKVVNYQIDIENFRYNDNLQTNQIREKLWEKPTLIDTYLMSNTTFSTEELALLRSWKKYYIKDRFILVKYEKDYAILMRAVDDEPPLLYGVKGITDSIFYTGRRELPQLVDLVLLPFGDKIIYDSYLGFYSINFSDQIKKSFVNEFKQALDANRLITNLGDK